MRCARCGGFMIIEPSCDEVKVQTDSENESQGRRCVNCGNVEDAVIHTNRLEPQSLRRAARHNLVIEPEVSTGRTGKLVEGSRQ